MTCSQEREAGDRSRDVASVATGVAVALGLFLLLCTPGSTPAQDTTAVRDTLPEVSPEHWPRVTGRLTDRATGEPIVGATLRIPEVGASALSDGQGRFTLPRVPPGSHQLEIQHVGYGAREVDVTVRADVTTRLQLRLEPEAVEVEPIEVRVEFRPEYLEDVGFYERRERGWGLHLDPVELDRLVGDTPWSQLWVKTLLTRQANTDIDLRGCPPACGDVAFYVDGRRQEMDHAAHVVFDLLGSDLGGVEIYPHGDGAPPFAMEHSLYNTTVIVIWTERW